ncbi:fumarylacetoacetate hydrolase family protein [Sphingorhabdus lacus]|uniref:fumarylacetoacetate hydrolase family protein n=1 Tax=Sphingorhabdus lacus TaxID=392610 RepID=UPI0035943125
MVVVAVVVFAAWATSPDLQFNPASFENDPLVQRLASNEEATTLAQFRNAEGQIRTILVTGYDKETVVGFDLREFGAPETDDPFEALAGADITPVLTDNADNVRRTSLPVATLLPTGTTGTRHIGTGTNFPEHADEANSGSVFQFPKFGPATAARTGVRAVAGVLLDYEVELCVRFDRTLRTPADFDIAAKGFFLCGDFTNRNALINLADPDNLDSGRGFSDAKSGPDFFPTGPFLVIPRDWKAFVSSVRMTTNINGSPRQDARGSEMTLDFRKLVEKAFSDMVAPRFLYQERFWKMVPEGTIPPAMTLMSGTAEGTIFTSPTRGDIIEAIAAYALQGGPFGKQTFLDVARKTFITNELAGGHYLKLGDTVHHGSNYLGDIVVKVSE